MRMKWWGRKEEVVKLGKKNEVAGVKTGGTENKYRGKYCRGYIRCDHFIVTHHIVVFNVRLFTLIYSVFVVQKR